MPTTYKVLGQVATSTLGANTEGTLYTVPSLTSAVASSIVICNQAGTAATFRIAVRPAADGSTTDKHWIVYGTTVGASDSTVITMGLTLAAGDKIQVRGSTATMSFSVYGSEIS
jgi:hypothetical protein